MNKKQVIRINENQLRQIVTECVKKVLNENGRCNLRGVYGQQHANVLLQQITDTMKQNPDVEISWMSPGNTQYIAVPSNGTYTLWAQSQNGKFKIGAATNPKELVQLFLNS